MDRFYEDFPLPQRGFTYGGPRPLMSTVIPKPSTHQENIDRNNVVGGKSPFHSSKPNSTNYGKAKSNGNKFLMHPPPRNIQRSHYDRFNIVGTYSRADVQPRVIQYGPGLSLNSMHNVHNIFQANLMHYNAYLNSSDELCSKKNKTPEQDKQSDAEAIKKSNLAAKLKKSLEAFKKNPSYQKKNLSIINKSDAKGGAGSSRYTSEIHPCFRWDLPLTVDDLKTIRRCPSGSASDDQPNPQDDVSMIERREYSFNADPITASPDIIYVKRCRKRKSSESMECGVSKRRLINHRRRHRSASPKLCLESNIKTVTEQCQILPGPHAVEETIDNGSLAVTTNGSSPSKEKSLQNSNVMQLLGIKRRELDELVNQPRSPRVQFMLGLLMKRHKELLLQRAMCSRISNVQNHEGTSNQSEELDLNPVIDSQSVTSKPIKLEGMGASDTIDELSNILLESSLATDISSLPQELIDQLGTFLEMGADTGTYNRSVDESSDGESNILLERSDNQGVSEDSRNFENVCGTKEEIGHDVISCFNEIRETSMRISPQRNIFSQGAETLGRVNYSGELNLNVNKPTCDEEIRNNLDSSVTFLRENQNDVAVKRKPLHRDEVNTSKNIWNRTDHLGASNSSACAGEPSELPSPNIPGDENSHNSQDHSQQNYSRQYFHTTSLQPDIMNHNETPMESEGHIIAKLWSIDNKILELMEEKKKLYQKLWRNKVMFPDSSDINSPLATLQQSSNTSTVQSIEEISCLESHSSVHTHENPIIPVSNVPNCPDIRIAVTESEDEICHLPHISTCSKSSQDFNQETSIMESENTQPSTSPKSPRVISLLRHENRTRKNKKQNVNCSPASDRHNGLLNSNVTMSLDRNLIEVSSKNCDGDVGDTSPQSVNLDPEIAEIIDEPVEIIYDSNVAEATNDRSEGEITGLKDAVMALKAAGKYLFACCADFCVHCFDIKTCKLLQSYKGHTGKVTCLHIDLSRKRMHLYSGSHDHRLRRFSIKGGTLQHSIRLTDPIQCMEQGWGFLYLGTKRGKIERYNIQNSDFVRGLSSMENEIMAIQTSKEGPRKVLIVACRNMPMIVRDAKSGLLLRTINEEMLKHTTYSLYEYQGLVFAGTSIYGVAACDFTNGKVVQTYKGCGSVVSVKVENDKVYAASYNGKIYIYDIKCSTPKHVIDASTRMLLCMDQKNNMIFAGSVSGQLKFWRTP